MTALKGRATKPTKDLSKRSRRRSTMCQLLCERDATATTAIAGLHICDNCVERVRAIAAAAGVTDGVP